MNDCRLVIQASTHPVSDIDRVVSRQDCYIHVDLNREICEDFNEIQVDLPYMRTTREPGRCWCSKKMISCMQLITWVKRVHIVSRQPSDLLTYSDYIQLSCTFLEFAVNINCTWTSIYLPINNPVIPGGKVVPFPINPIIMYNSMTQWINPQPHACLPIPPWTRAAWPLGWSFYLHTVCNYMSHNVASQIETVMWLTFASIATLLKLCSNVYMCTTIDRLSKLYIENCNWFNIL